MSRTQQALRLAFADYPICSELGRRMSDNEAARTIKISQSGVSKAVKVIRMKNKTHCPTCGRPLNFLGE